MINVTFWYMSPKAGQMTATDEDKAAGRVSTLRSSMVRVPAGCREAATIVRNNLLDGGAIAARIEG